MSLRKDFDLKLRRSWMRNFNDDGDMDWLDAYRKIKEIELGGVEEFIDVNNENLGMWVVKVVDCLGFGGGGREGGKIDGEEIFNSKSSFLGECCFGWE